jgi:hypothetical protein
VATDQQRLAALQWAAGLRGASDPEEAISWMTQRGLAEFDFDTETLTLTEEGEKRGDELYESLARVPESKRRRTNGLLWLAGAAVIVWRWRK